MNVYKKIDFRISNYLNKLIIDYINSPKKINKLFDLDPLNINNFFEKAKYKIKSYSSKDRELLYDELSKQLFKINIKEKQKYNISSILEPNSVTITTGHGLNILTGPIYVFYKIIQTIKICEILNDKYKNINFIPIFWMATEDHDFEEINNLNYNNKKFIWNQKYKINPVGNISTLSLKEFFNNLLSNINNQNKKREINKILENSYYSSDILYIAHAKIINILFGDYGIIPLNPNSKILKKSLHDIIKDELINNTSYKKVHNENIYLRSMGYKPQVNPRKINLFYIYKNKRTLINYDNHNYIINNTIKKSENEILNDIKEYPERFSPNVILRPIYQEKILPNIAYIGGGSELSYWLQLKSTFKYHKIDFPILCLRNSLILLTKKQQKKISKINIEYKDLFLSLHEIKKKSIVYNSSSIKKILEKEKKINEIFKELTNEYSYDISYINMIKAQNTKQIKGMRKIYKRIIKNEIKNNKLKSLYIENIINSISLKNTIQEREKNFLNFDYCNIKSFIKEIKEIIDPFDCKIIIYILS